MAVVLSSPLTRQQIAELGALLEAERERLLAHYQSDVEREREIGYEDVEDTLDDVAKDLGRERLFTQVESEREQLRLVEEALQRIEQGTYGRCLQTGRPIPLARLRAVPWARFVAEVQADREIDVVPVRVEPAVSGE
jgi:DnaK suppressor protein